MSSEFQIKANRQNSQKSTGPKSAEGKKAVAKNAVKHGLFSNETVIKGESAEEFETFRDEMLAELAPVGPVESMLAERYVSLSWRLKRVERMQNQAIDVMIEQDEQPNPFAKLAQSMLPKNLRQSPVDASASNGELALGRVAIKDYSNSRVLDRLMMYERRIENSMFRTFKELERLRLMRELKQANEAEEQPAIPEASGFEAATQKIPPLGKAATQKVENPSENVPDKSRINSFDSAQDRFAKQFTPKGSQFDKSKAILKNKANLFVMRTP